MRLATGGRGGGPARLRAFLDAKTHASYSGIYHDLEDAERLLGEAAAYVTWAEELLANRPCLTW